MPNADADAALLAHKIAAPQPHRNAVQRRALLIRFAESGRERVFFIHGPAGHGKTSLMLQADAAARAKGMATGWLSLDETDNDNRRFLGQLQRIFDGLGQGHPNAAGIDPEPAVSEPGPAWLFNQVMRIERPTAIFLDDLHTVTNPATIGLLRQLLLSSPPHLHWYIASRTLPDLAVARLVVNEEAVIIEARELRFTRDETRTFFERAGRFELTPEEQETIYQITEGWPAALQLYRLALHSPDVRADLRQRLRHQPRELTDYLADNVLAHQKPEVKDFLIRTSWLQRMSAPLCDAILGRSDSYDILSTLERAGLFVRRHTSEEGWYTYHAIFSQFLQHHARSVGPDSVKDIHRRSAEWYRANGFLEDAIHHYCQAGEYAQAADSFDILAERLVPDGQMVTVERWSDEMPLAELERRPGLTAKVVWALSFLLSRHRKLDPLLKILREAPRSLAMTADPTVARCMARLLEDDLADAKRIVTDLNTNEPSTSAFRAFELSAVANARGYAAMASGDFDDALAQLVRGRELSDQGGATFTWAYSIGKTAITLIAQGRLQEAQVRIRAALADPRMFAVESISKACLASGYIMALYEADELDTTLEFFLTVRDRTANAFIHDYLVVAYTAIARIYDVRGQPERALNTLDEAEDLAYAGHWPRVTRLIKWARVHRELLAGRLDQAQIIAGRIAEAEAPPAVDWVRFSEEVAGEEIGLIRLDIHTGEPRRALDRLAPVLAAAETHKRVFRQIKLYALAALAEMKLGNEAAAHRRLERALRLATPGGYLRSFLDEGEMMAQLLMAHARLKGGARPGPSTCYCDRATGDFLVRLVQAISGDPGDQTAAPKDVVASAAGRLEGFTKRELVALSMLVKYASNEQIAAAMFVTKDTLKYHLKNIYGKLGVSTRLEAIRVALDLGLK